MSIFVFPNGIGSTTGVSLVTARPYETTGSVRFVHFGTGNDSSGSAGLERDSPLKTLSAAYTASSDYDDVVFLSGHAETLTTTQTIAKRLRFSGEGGFGTTSMPTFTCGADVKMFDVTVSKVQFRGIRVAASTVANTHERISLTSTDALVDQCYIESGNFDRTIKSVQLAASADRTRISSSTFISTATAVTTAPAGAIGSGGALADLSLLDLVIDGGTYGWVLNGIYLGAGAVTNLQIYGASLLRNSNLSLLTAGTTASITLGTCSGSSQVKWL